MTMQPELHVRLATLNDCDLLFRWRNKEAIYRYFYNNFPVEFEDHVKWLQKSLNDPSMKISIFQNHLSALGLTYFKRAVAGSIRVFWSFYLGEENCPKGYGSIMATLAIRDVFKSWGSDIEIVGEVLSENVVSRGFHEKMGFVLNSVEKRFLSQRGESFDVYIYTLTWSQWLKRESQ